MTDPDPIVGEVSELRAPHGDAGDGAPSGRRHTRRRRIFASLLVALACTTLLASLIGVWARRNVLDSDRFGDRMAAVAADPAVQDVLATKLTTQLMTLVDPEAFFSDVLPNGGRLIAGPLTNAIEGFVHDRVVAVLASDTFQEVFVKVATIAHDAAIRSLRGEGDVLSATNGTVTLNLLPIVNAVLAEISQQASDLLGRDVQLPEVDPTEPPGPVIQRLEAATGRQLSDDFGQITVYDNDTLVVAQRAVDYLDRGALFVAVLPPLLAGLALWVSPRRRRTILQLCVGVIVGMVVLRRVGFRIEDEISALPPTAQGAAAVGFTIDEFIGPLLTFALWMMVLAALGAIAALVSGDYAWAVAFRSRAKVVLGLAGPSDDVDQAGPTTEWVLAHRDAVMVAGGVTGLVILWAFDLSWLGVLLVLILVGLFEAAALRIGEHSIEPSEPAASP